MIRIIKNWYHYLNGLLALIWYGRPASKMVVIGVTGTDGKTTTASMIYHILQTLERKVALIGTVAAYIGKDQIDTGFHVTSPGPWQLQKLLRRIVEEGNEVLVLEVTSHGIDQHRLLGVPLETAVYTNVTPEHLDYHKTYDQYLATKARLMRGVRRVILNSDDESYGMLKKRVPESVLLGSYSLKGDRKITSSLARMFPEKFNQSNALAALMAVEHYGVDVATGIQALSSFGGIPGRMERIQNTRGIEVVVDFAHTPQALEEALSSLRSQMSSQRASLIAVYGAAGLRDSYKRPLMGEIGTRLADMVVLTSEDPRSEDPRVIIRQMKEQLTIGHGKVVSMVDRAAAIDFAINTLARKGDVVGIFGKGHEKSMNMDGKEELPWSDQKVALEALSKK